MKNENQRTYSLSQLLTIIFIVFIIAVIGAYFFVNNNIIKPIQGSVQNKCLVQCDKLNMTLEHVLNNYCVCTPITNYMVIIQ